MKRRSYSYRSSSGYNRGIYKAGKNIYSGAAAYGRINSIFTLLITSLIGIISILFGLSLLFKSKDSQISATVSEISDDSRLCRTYSSNQEIKPYSGLCVKFKIDGTTFFTPYLPVNKYYAKGEQVTLFQNENGYSVTESSPKTTGVILIIFGVFIILLGYFSYHFAHQSKTYAAIQGGAAILNWFR
jgi:hypothetical protein